MSERDVRSVLTPPLPPCALLSAGTTFAEE